MSSTEPSMAELGARPVDVPEDVLAELDAEQPRTRAEPVVSLPNEEGRHGSRRRGDLA